MTDPTPDPLALKLMIVGRRKPGTTLAEHHHHIRQVHGELVLGYIASEPQNAPRRYVQNQVVDGTFRAAPVAGDRFALGRDFVTQVWMPDFAALARSRETAYYRDHLMGDEDNFVDQATVVFMPVKERELFARSGDPAAGGCKLFCFLEKAADADPARFANAWNAVGQALRDGPTGAGIRRQVQNQVLPGPGPKPTVDAIDEFWLGDEAAASALLRQWRHAVDTALVAPGLATANGPFALIANEAVLHAGPR